ncbi:hypothetical protein RB2083_3170 [Rhodobacteraceae bacterium HTCC2083]|nr:hypothetical protein RB2083_3170 [Rhodobacteraceae bacterium HTCC2083]
MVCHIDSHFIVFLLSGGLVRQAFAESFFETIETIPRTQPTASNFARQGC